MKRIILAALLLAAPALARSFNSTITEGDRIEHLRPEFKTPDEPNQLFYVQRSPNANTVIYAARLDDKGEIDRGNPVEGFWRKFNIDGSKQSLNMIERMMAYGVRAARPVLETIAQYVHEQGLTPARVAVEDVFAKSTLDV